jgi:hypothetical protein
MITESEAGYDERFTEPEVGYDVWFRIPDRGRGNVVSALN